MIVFLDDEPERMRLYERALRLVYPHIHIECLANIPQALELIRAGQVDLLFLDLMMPPGPLGAQETQDGFRTGVVIYNIIRNTYSKNLPIAILTNVMSMEAKTASISKHDDYCYYFTKRELNLQNIIDFVGKQLT